MIVATYHDPPPLWVTAVTKVEAVYIFVVAVVAVVAVAVVVVATGMMYWEKNFDSSMCKRRYYQMCACFHFDGCCFHVEKNHDDETLSHWY